MALDFIVKLRNLSHSLNIWFSLSLKFIILREDTEIGSVFASPNQRYVSVCLGSSGPSQSYNSQKKVKSLTLVDSKIVCSLLSLDLYLLGPVDVWRGVAGGPAPQLDVLPLLDHKVAVWGVRLHARGNCNRQGKLIISQQMMA